MTPRQIAALIEHLPEVVDARQAHIDADSALWAYLDTPAFTRAAFDRRQALVCARNDAHDRLDSARRTAYLSVPQVVVRGGLVFSLTSATD